MIIGFIGFFILGVLAGIFSERDYRPNNQRTNKVIEREARLLLSCNNTDEIRVFIKSEITHLKSESFNALLSRMQELNADELLNEEENNLKIRIDSLPEKEVELRKLQAESFLETCRTIRSICK